MAWLRWILLLAGVLFIAALAWRESRRGRQDVEGGTQRARRIDPPLEPVATAGEAAEDEMDDAEAVGFESTLLHNVETERGVDHFIGDPLPVAEMPQHMVTLLEDEPATVTTVDFLIGPEPAPAPTPPPAPSIAEWPLEEIRRICSLRLTPLRKERFAGRALRQCLQAAGFQHGELGIFHLPGAAGRAMMSVANLSRPGQLDPSIMDYQRFAGLHLFTVLPGRVSNRVALQQLFVVADALTQRLDGVVQDVNGRVLDATRMAELQQQFADDAPAAATSE